MAAVAENGHAVTDENPAPAVATSSDEAITVFHNPENFNVKHPLMHEWTLWFTKPPSGKVRIRWKPVRWIKKLTLSYLGR
jgi:translation initiation factor 4E